MGRKEDDETSGPEWMEITTIRADLAASQREVERLRHGVATAEDGVCPDAVEVVKLRAEVERCRELIIELVANACEVDAIPLDAVPLDSCGMRANADALRYLAEIGRVEIVSEHGRRVIGRWKP